MSLLANHSSFDGKYLVMKRLTLLLWRNERGVAALEYALIAALVAVFIVGAVTKFGKNEAKAFTTVEKAMKPAKLGL